MGDQDQADRDGAQAVEGRDPSQLAERAGVVGWRRRQGASSATVTVFILSPTWIACATSMPLVTLPNRL